MSRYIFLALWFAVFSPLAQAMGNDDPLLVKTEVSRLEHLQAGDSEHLAWDVSAWLGHDLQKLVVETRGERGSREVEESEWALFYQQALDANWDWQAGIQFDTDNSPRRNWLVLGLDGEAPYFIETRLQLLLGESGRSAIHVELEKELLLSQSWALIPELELVINGHNDPDRQLGSGLSEVQAGLRIGYLFNPQFMLYAGAARQWKFGETADLARNAGDSTTETQWMVGTSFWF